MIELKGGKTAARLLDDLNSYDPRRLSVTSFNHLTQLPFQHERGGVPVIPSTKGRCQHKWNIKENQGYLYLIIARVDPKQVSTVAAFCEHCRCHLKITIDFSDPRSSPCPTEVSLLHHFRHDPDTSRSHRIAGDSSMANDSADWEDLQCFHCSTIECSARLKISIKPPRLRPQWVELLTNKSLIRSRAQKVMADSPERFEGHAVPFPIDVLSYLTTYISNALREEERRSIPAHNKKFLLSLGDACSDLLQFLGFVREEEAWLPPAPDVSATAPISNPTNLLLEDVEKELQVLMLQRPSDEKRASKVQYGLNSATRELKRIFGAAEYMQNPSARTSTTDIEHPCFPSLGAKYDFANDLILFSYNCQLMSDPENTPYYLECLDILAEGRNSHDLKVAVATEASMDKASRRDIRNAYKTFDLEIASGFLNDDFIIGTFQSRIADSPKQAPELRQALGLVGRDRSSQRIQVVASNSTEYISTPSFSFEPKLTNDVAVSNYQEALLWLNGTADTGDDWVISMYNQKVADPDCDEKTANTARHAVSLIAHYRQSNVLQEFLGEAAVDINQAYNRLQISDRTVDDQTVLVAFKYFYEEAPSRIDDLRSALRVIAADRNSKMLLNFLHSRVSDEKHPPGEWPVGLANIGNTCYLNSLLQFYFTIKPLRQLVHDFEEYKLDLDMESSVKRTVGSRRVSRGEVQRAQKFVYGLQNLFEHMIVSSNAHVTPELELARLTLLSQPAELDLRRRSTVGGKRPSVGEINGKPILGPLSSPIPEVATSGVNGTELPTENQTNGISEKKNVDASSDATLLADDTEMLDSNGDESQQQKAFEDKENLPPSKAAFERQTTPDHTMQPLAEASPSRTNEQPELNGRGHQQQDPLSPKKAEEVVAPPPTRPPPFPPRPQTEEQKKAVMEEVQIGAQQDVTEVIANVLFQLQCAIKPTSLDPSGEQIDLVKNMFFGKQKFYTPDTKGVPRSNEQFFSSLIVDVASGRKDLYEALHGAFDVQEVEVEGSQRPQYTTISVLPPVLSIHVQRVQYDRVKESAVKSEHFLELKETIYMDRYMDSENADFIRRRKESWDWKQQLQRLESRRQDLMKAQLEMDLPELLATTRECLDRLGRDEDLGTTGDLAEEIEKAAMASKDEVDSINASVEELTSRLRAQFATEEYQSLPYRLQSVFIHVGKATHGHYWIYIRDFKNNVWRKYNDETVSTIDSVSEIFDQHSNDRPATPYFLVYVKDEVKDEFVEPLCRHIKEVPAPEAESRDSVMEDVMEPNGVMYDNIAIEGGGEEQGTAHVVLDGGWFNPDPVQTRDW